MVGYPGIFVGIEGIDGSGKTTQRLEVCKKLAELDIPCYATCEPSRNKIGLLLREYLVRKESSPYVDALLFAADRVEHYHDEILPKLNEGNVVISDRYVYSSIVYQGSRGVSKEWILEINKMAPLPDMTIYLDIPVEEAMKRLTEAKRDVIEKFEDIDQLKKLREIYQKLQMNNQITIDATLPKEEITDLIVRKILNKLN